MNNIRKTQILVRCNPGEAHSRSIYRGILRYMRQHKPWVAVHHPNRDCRWSDPETYLDFDGAILQITGRHVASVVSSLPAHYPIVNISGSVTDLGYPMVTVDNSEIGRMAARHLMRVGVRSFAFLDIGSGRAFAKLRWHGFDEELKKVGHDAVKVPSAARKSHFLEIMSAMPVPIGLMAANDTTARNALELLLDQEIRVPDDIAIIGVDNDDLQTEMTAVPLTSIDTNGVIIGYRAAELMHRMLRGLPVNNRYIQVPPGEISKRESTSILHSHNPELVAAIRFINEHVAEKISVDEIAQAACVSRRKLERLFRSQLGRSPLQELRARRVDYVRSLLASSRMSMESIAKASGFANSKVLSMIFRREMGMTPSEYRQQFD